MRDEELRFVLTVFAFTFAWVGHTCVLVSILNNLYGRPLSKTILKPLRVVTGVLILAFPLLIVTTTHAVPVVHRESTVALVWWTVVYAYGGVCVVIGALGFPLVTLTRFLRKTPRAVTSESTDTLDLWPELGSKLHGDGKWSWVPRLPLNCVYRVDLTDLRLALPDLPPEWEGLTILHLSDLHFHGTPSRVFFERVLAEVESRWPTPDLVCLAGDYVDTDRHHEWIGPLLGRLTANEGKFAILGNHDEHHHPEHLREELTSAGYHVVGNDWRVVPIRGRPAVVIGHEGPWFAPPPDLASLPPGHFRLCLSHSPDNYYWGRKGGIDLMLCGHVHGGQIRLPVIGSIFVPSVYGRRFDQGVFEDEGTVMVVSRGLSGKEPLRFRCHPQVIRITVSRRVS
jgi:predicted MPP superfamily phosphohydrolase